MPGQQVTEMEPLCFIQSPEVMDVTTSAFQRETHVDMEVGWLVHLIGL